MKKKILNLFLIILTILLLFIVTGCGEKNNNNENNTESEKKNVSIIDNMKNEAKDEIENMFNYNSSGYTYVEAKSLEDKEKFDENMVTKGVYKFEENGKTYYYFRGDVQNNYLKFGKNADGEEMYWRIIRTNGDGTIRLLYNGTSTENGDKSIGEVSYHSKTGMITDANYSTSNVKKMVESWYQKNLKDTGYDEYVAEELFVNDISYKTENTRENFGANYRTRFNYFIADNAKPSLDNIDGAENLKLKVGIITADEALMAGANVVINSKGENEPYIEYGAYWTMSPENYYSPSSKKDNGTVSMLVVSSSLLGRDSYAEAYVVPVINLSTDALKNVTGTGTATDPYVVK